MNKIASTGTMVLLLILSGSTFAQFPSLSEAFSGHSSMLKPPSFSDLRNFSKKHSSHLVMLSRRSKKAHRKSFLKFVAIEDELLYTLCDSNEFQANMLMRSAMASFGRIESDMQQKSAAEQKTFYQKENAVNLTASISRNIVNSISDQKIEPEDALDQETSLRTGSNLYAEYMAKRLRIYATVFEDGSKLQRKLYRKLKIKASLWQAYKEEDKNLIARFADNNFDVMKHISGMPDFAKEMAAMTPDYSAALLLASASNENSTLPDLTSLKDELKSQLEEMGLVSKSNQKNDAKLTDILSNIKQQKDSLASWDKDKNNKVKKNTTADKVKAQRFWDRLYGGADFNWQDSKSFYPEGFGIVLTGGYKISNNSGLNLEFNTVLNGSKIGFGEDLNVESTLICNYSLGANIDYRVWKFIFLGAGTEGIVNNIEVPADNFYYGLKDTHFTIGVPIILRLIAPISAISGTNIELRYDLNAENNIKPTFDFRVGFIIGR